MYHLVLRPLLHRGKECIGLYFTFTAELNRLVRGIKDCRWSRNNQCWYVPLSREYYIRITTAFRGLASIDQTALDQYLQKKDMENPGNLTGARPQDPGKTMIPLAGADRVATVFKEEKIDPVNAHVLPALRQHLRLKAYSRSTTRTYITEMTQLLKTLKDIPADQLTPEHLKRYFVYCFEKLGLAENTLHSRINALKFYYEQVLGREKFFWEIPRPKKPLQLPRFFNQEEVTAIIKAAGNIKHRTMLMLAYSSGMRVSEVVSVRTNDVDSRRMCILVRQAKGKKDRMVALSPVLLVMLREYWTKYRPSREGYLFPGQLKNEPYSSRSLQLVLAEAKKKAGVLKQGSIHALRHSFATHLLDKGTDVTMIMKLLGHNDLKTTLRYLHVTNRDMLQVISPLDNLDLS